MKDIKILLVEDNFLVSEAVRNILEDEEYYVDVADTGKKARSFLKKDKYSLAILDMMLPDTTGQKLLKKWETEYPEMIKIFMTAHGDIPTAVECLKMGAFDFLTKPVKKPLMLKTIENGIKQAEMGKQVKVLTQLSQTQRDLDNKMSKIIGNSDALQKTLKILKMVTATDFSTLLITGESGTGKGLLAQTIYKTGLRSNKPFIEVNCSALPPNLIESELFGHTKGAFTDAKQDKMGIFEMADGGTLFLDEIGDMDINLQSKLLKVLEEQKFRRIGGTKDITVDVAIIAATNQQIEKSVEENKFRLDLYYRLNVIPINIPPLRNRMDDLPDLAKHFISFFSRKFGKEIEGFSKEAFDILNSYSWPGNIREFRNIVERASILTTEKIISDPDILFPSGMNKKFKI